MWGTGAQDFNSVSSAGSSCTLICLSPSSPWCGSHYAESILELDTVQGNIPAGGFRCWSLPTIEPEISTTPFTTTYPKRKAAVARLAKYSDVDGRIRAAPRGMEHSPPSLSTNHRKSSVGLCSRPRPRSLVIGCRSLLHLSSNASLSSGLQPRARVVSRLDVPFLPSISRGPRSGAAPSPGSEPPIFRNPGILCFPGGSVFPLLIRSFVRASRGQGAESWLRPRSRKARSATRD